MKYKVLAFDIDGTLTNSHKAITPATRECIMEAQRRGIKVVIASGRPVQGMRAFAEELKIKEYGGYILSLNGGLLISCEDGHVIHDVKLPQEYYKEICGLAREYGVDILTYEGDDVICENIDNKYLEIEARINGLGVKHVENLPEYLTFPVNKFLMLGDGDYLGRIEPNIHDILGDRMDVYRSEPFFLEVLPKNINKARALEHLLGVMNVSKDELMAFGDGYNDLSMIEYAGTGVAMSNGNDVVKNAADIIAPSNDEDGIVDILKKFVLD